MRLRDVGHDGLPARHHSGRPLAIGHRLPASQALGRPSCSPEVRNFTGIKGHGAQKGALITTSKFTRDATDSVKRLQQKKLVLIDGEKPAQLMMIFGAGVNRVAIYTVQKIDPDYFGDE